MTMPSGALKFAIAVFLLVAALAAPGSVAAQTVLTMNPIDNEKIEAIAVAHYSRSQSFQKALKSGERIVRRDVRYAKFDLDNDGVDEIFLAETDLWSCASMSGCGLDVLQKRGAIWVNICTCHTMVDSNPNDIKVFDTVDFGYRRFSAAGRVYKWRGPSLPKYIDDRALEERGDGLKLQPGTALATFNKDGRYESNSTGNHAVIFLGYGEDENKKPGMKVLEQWGERPPREGYKGRPAHPVREQFIPFENGTGIYQAKLYSVIKPR